MSTRCTVHFKDGGHEAHSEAIIYRHSDGYTECMIPDLANFFKAVQDQTNDTRFSDPSYLASKYVVWLASQFSRNLEKVNGEYVWVNGSPLDFLSVGVVQSDPGDIEYRYTVRCDKIVDGVPQVSVEEV